MTFEYDSYGEAKFTLLDQLKDHGVCRVQDHGSRKVGICVFDDNSVGIEINDDDEYYVIKADVLVHLLDFIRDWNSAE